MKSLWIFLAVMAPVPVVGQQISNFKLTDVVTRQTISLDSYPSCEGMVIIFSSNACPYDEYYRKRILTLANRYNDKVPVILVNAGTDPAESEDKMLQKAKVLNLSIPYLSDKDQVLMTSLDARKSPEAFLLENDNGKFRVVYRGAIDDNPQVEADVKQFYLRDAIDIMLTHQKIETPEVRPVGCNLKKKG